MDDPGRWSDPRGGAPPEIQRMLAAARGGPPPLPDSVRIASATAVARLGGAATASGWWSALKIAGALSVVGVVGASVAHRSARPPHAVRAPSTSSPRLPPTAPTRPHSPPTPGVVPLPAEPIAARVAPAHPPAASDHRRDPEAEAATLERARQLLASGDTPRSLAALHEHARRFPRSDLAEERDYLTFRASVRDATQAVVDREADRFLQRHPNGIYSSQVRSMSGTHE
jgi:hypothetical protein